MKIGGNNAADIRVRGDLSMINLGHFLADPSGGVFLQPRYVPRGAR